MTNRKSRAACCSVRVLINLDAGDKAWLEREAGIRNLSVIELVRHAVHDYPLRCLSRAQPDLQAALSHTAGIWKHCDGLSHQQFLREEWSGCE